MLGTMADFSLDNLSNNPKFDFLQTLLKEKDEADNFPNFSFADSPYDSSIISCNYMCENEFVTKYSNPTKPSVLSINIQSLPAKFNAFCEFISSLKFNNCAPEIICLQEIWKLPNDEFFNIDGYHPLVYKSRLNSIQGGGVGIYVSSKLSFSVNDELSIFVDRILESVFIDVIINSKKFTIGSLYRPGTAHPNLNASEQFSQFLELFSSISDCATRKSYPVFIFGDTNIDCLKYNSSPNSTEFVDLLFSNGLLQIVTKPTRCTPNSATIIDHIITNHVSGIFETIIFISQLSDHFPVLSFISLSKTVSKPANVQSRDFSELNISNLKNSLSTLGWVNVTEQQDPQLAFNNFSDTFSTFYNLHMPLKTKKFNRNFSKIEPWMTTGLLISRRKKIVLTKDHYCSPSPNSISTLKLFRNLYNKTIRAAKKMYFESELKKNQSNLKKSWDIIRGAINKKSSKSSTISNIVHNNCNINDPTEMANCFNTFFTNVSSKIVGEIHPTHHPPDNSFRDDVPIFSLSKCYVY